ncbi:peptidoglycan DD-metalloendopeptidase family protein [Paraburkholderia phytofirmans]|uniref:peptidoglycan DD-metalloendopeptidase family protein n=1 Tax=Paraburkholderia phytofirmans TaxID=261302 RepID=UPI0038B711DB
MKTCSSRVTKSGSSVLFALLLAASLTSCALPSSGAPPARPTHVDEAPPPATAFSNAPTPVPTSQVPAGFYRVNPGDTQIGVAKALGREPSALAQWNQLSPTDGLRVGQVLRVAPPLVAGAPSATGASSNSLAQARAIFADGPSESASAKARLAWPVSGQVSAPFVSGKTKGILIGGRVGEPVRASAGGRVVYAGGRIAAYGKLIIIKHDAHLLTAYGSNRVLLVKEGADVKAGEVIAEMGADDKGQASLRFEVRADGKPVDPLKYLPKRP